MTTFSSPIQSTEATSQAEAPTTPKAVNEAKGGVFPDSILNYSQLHNRPYTADYFKITEYREIYGKPNLDVFHVMPKIKEIEEYVKNSIESRGLEDRIETYDFLINEVLEQIGDEPMEDIRHKFDRVAIYASKNKDVERTMKMNLLQKQVSELKKQVREMSKFYVN